MVVQHRQLARRTTISTSFSSGLGPRSISRNNDGATMTLARRTYTTVLLQAGFAELDLPIPWWGDRRLRFKFR